MGNCLLSKCTMRAHYYLRRVHIWWLCIDQLWNVKALFLFLFLLDYNKSDSIWTKFVSYLFCVCVRLRMFVSLFRKSRNTIKSVCVSGERQNERGVDICISSTVTAFTQLFFIHISLLERKIRRHKSEKHEISEISLLQLCVLREQQQRLYWQSERLKQVIEWKCNRKFSNKDYKIKQNCEQICINRWGIGCLCVRTEIIYFWCLFFYCLLFALQIPTFNGKSVKS